MARHRGAVAMSLEAPLQDVVAPIRAALLFIAGVADHSFRRYAPIWMVRWRCPLRLRFRTSLPPSGNWIIKIAKLPLQIAMFNE
eukprot:1488006-Amphidinium_carterae.3